MLGTGPFGLHMNYTRLQKSEIWAWDDLCWFSFSTLWGSGTVMLQLSGFYCKPESSVCPEAVGTAWHLVFWKAHRIGSPQVPTNKGHRTKLRLLDLVQTPQHGARTRNAATSSLPGVAHVVPSRVLKSIVDTPTKKPIHSREKLRMRSSR